MSNKFFQLGTIVQVQQLQELLTITAKMLDPDQFTATLSNVFEMCGQGKIEPGEPLRVLIRVGLDCAIDGLVDLDHPVLYVEYRDQDKPDTNVFTLHFSPRDGLLALNWETD